MANKLATLRLGDHTDTATVGLQLRVRKQSRTWLFRFKWQDQWVRMTIGHHPATSLIEAREKAQHYAKHLSDGIDPRNAVPRRPAPSQARTATARSANEQANRKLQSKPADPHSVARLAHEFMAKYVEPNRKNPSYVEAILAKDVLPHWSNRDARTIKPREVIELLDGVVERGSKIMANRVAGILSQMFRYGVHRALVDASPVQLLFRPGGKEKPRERTLSDSELQAFLRDTRACTRFERLEHVILILLLTGQRRGELALTRWSDIDVKAKTWTIPAEHSKNGRQHVVPLSQWAVDEFDELRGMADQSRWVLPSADPSKPVDPKQLTRSLAKCRARFKARGIKEFTLHDLRRTCRTGLGKLKIPPHIAERVVNHAQEKMVATYDTGEYLDEKRDALDKWAKHLKSLAEPK